MITTMIIIAIMVMTMLLVMTISVHAARLAGSEP